ncbi:MAG: hypothetical protein PHW27_13345 [Melioribacteraceae bacterium]|nr:hypothetical protein [Melioribacteraceae bacterium]MDD3559544.1 hypothetical protein [Melioribacteraceae bacterium]
MIVNIKNSLIIATRQIYYNIKFLLLMWVSNSIGALVLTIPVYYLLTENLSRSLVSDRLAAGFDYLWFIQFSNLYKSNLEQLPYLIYSIVGVYTLVQTFFLGGLISIFHLPKKNHMVDFFYGGVKFWLRFFKILLISLVLFAAAFIINDLLGDLISWAFERTGNYMTDFILRSLRYIILIILIGFVTIVSDYAKVHIGVTDDNKIFNSIKLSVLFIKHNFNIVFTVFFLVAVIGALGAIVYNIIEIFIPRTPYYFLVLAFILQQMLVIFRLAVRMLFYSTEVFLYKDLNADFIEPVIVEKV